MNEDFNKVLKLYKSVKNKYIDNMKDEMKTNDFFLDFGMSELLNLSYEEHKSLKEEIPNENLDYTSTKKTLEDRYSLSDYTIKMLIEDEYEDYKRVK